MPPTLDWLDGFEHQTESTLRFGGAATDGIASLVTLPADITFPAGRNGVALQIAGAASAPAYASREFPANAHRILGGYFKASAAPSVAVRLFIIRSPGGAANRAVGWINANGTIAVGIASPDQTGPNICDGAWHRIELYLDLSTTTHRLKWRVDDVAQTDATNAGTAGVTSGRLDWGFTAASTFTFQVDDWIGSLTAADYPLSQFAANHKVSSLFPNGDGTHVISGAGDFDKGDGTDILASTTDAWTEIDDWITGAAELTTYVQDTAGASTEYTEHTFEDTTEATIWAVVGFAACFSANTAADLLTVRIVDSGGATVADIVANLDVSETALHYRTVLVQQNPTQAQVNAYKVRIGLSTDVAPDPRCSAVMLQYAVPEVAAAPPTNPWVEMADYVVESAIWR